MRFLFDLGISVLFAQVVGELTFEILRHVGCWRVATRERSISAADVVPDSRNRFGNFEVLLLQRTSTQSLTCELLSLLRIGLRTCQCPFKRFSTAPARLRSYLLLQYLLACLRGLQLVERVPCVCLPPASVQARLDDKRLLA